MAKCAIHKCKCQSCRTDTPVDSSCEEHRNINWFMSQLSTDQRRWYAAIEARRIGKTGASRISEITGLSCETIRRGRAEVLAYAKGEPEKRKKKVGRSPIREIYPDIEGVLETLLGDDVAGDPMCEKKWIRRSSRNLSKELLSMGYKVNYHLVCDMLKELGYSLKVNVKKRASTRCSPMRDAQFKYIAAQKEAFLDVGHPVISVDSKKKELIGNFKVNGRAWCKAAIEVNRYTFTSIAECVAAPYGVYDVAKNTGFVAIGTSTDSPEFAVASIQRWWLDVGQAVYPQASKLLILADGGGSNSSRSRSWVQQIQKQLSDRFFLEVTVSHYPPGCSKYNPVERRLFAPISMNWQGMPLQSLRHMLAYIRGTTNKSGLTVEATILDGHFPRGEKVSVKQLGLIQLRRHSTCPEWNYTVSPRNAVVAD
jgi:hypothetical protein